MYNNVSYKTLENLVNLTGNSDELSRALEIMKRLSMDCLNPCSTPKELNVLAEQAQSLCPVLTEFPEWEIVRTAITERKFFAVSIPLTACINKLHEKN